VKRLAAVKDVAEHLECPLEPLESVKSAAQYIFRVSLGLGRTSRVSYECSKIIRLSAGDRIEPRESAKSSVQYLKSAGNRIGPPESAKGAAKYLESAGD
jgi:hypothetical protein